MQSSKHNRILTVKTITKRLTSRKFSTTSMIKVRSLYLGRCIVGQKAFSETGFQESKVILSRETTPKPHETLACIREGRACSEGPLLFVGAIFNKRRSPLRQGRYWLRQRETLPRQTNQTHANLWTDLYRHIYAKHSCNVSNHGICTYVVNDALQAFVAPTG
jgi:hypothetical protein